MKHFKSLIGVFLLLFPSSVFAGGSVAAQDILSLLRQQPELYEYVANTLELDKVGWATRIGLQVNPDLAGRRVAPYHIKARPKGSKGEWLFFLTIDAVTSFSNTEGKDVPLHEGKSVQEKLIGIRLRPIAGNEVAELN